ncbi:hypothetical protein HDU83_004940, partial [Entophlyctis luteolus]
MDFEFWDAPGGANAVTYEMALQKLADFYGVSDVAGALNELASVSGPRRPTWAAFNNKNKLGFLNGILTHSPDQNMRDYYASKFFWTFGTSRLPEPGTVEEKSCLQLLYNRFIHIFRQHGRGSSDSSPHESAFSIPIESSTALDLNAANPAQSNFRAALLRRDKVCLFCWEDTQLDAAHLIAQKKGAPMTAGLENILSNLLSRANLDSIYRVQNGILLCKVCHGEFDALHYYFDVVDGCLVAKVVNLTNDRNREYVNIIGKIEHNRNGFILRDPEFAGRNALDANNELLVSFVDDNTANHPNHTALAFHKAACLIWKMAGAADYNDDDGMDEGSVDSLLAK